MSRLNRIAAAVGLVAGGLGTWALLRAASPSVTPPAVLDREDNSVISWDEVHVWPTLESFMADLDRIRAAEYAAVPEWRRRLAEQPGPSANWYARRHHCTDDVIGVRHVAPRVWEEL